MTSSAGHETTDAKPKPLLFFGLALVIMTVVTFILMWFMFRWMEQVNDGDAAMKASSSKPGSPLIHAVDDIQRLELENFRQWEEETLTSFGWVNQKEGIVRIPVESAMDLILERGLPAPQVSKEMPPPPESVVSKVSVSMAATVIGPETGEPHE